MESQPIILFGQLKGFPTINDGAKISTIEFLQASKEIVSLIEGFGKVFMPIVYDMNGNIEKLMKFYNKNEADNIFLEDMVLNDLRLSNSNSICVDALLWLKRALELLEKFFTNIFNDKTCEENLKKSLQDAYYETLRPYHGWLVQEAFGLIYRFVPQRSRLVGKGSTNDINMENLEIYMTPLRIHLNQINLFYSEHNLNCSRKSAKLC